MFTLPQLSYEYSALEPAIDARTMEIHHSKHHQGYVDKLNAALNEHQELQKMDVVELMKQLNSLPDQVQTAVRNNGGGHANHSLFWQILTPGGDTSPSGELESAIADKFESLDNLKSELLSTTGSQFGSGWGWLVVNQDKSLEVMSTPNQDTPLSQGKTPILGIDVWEHAYYLSYQNKRPDYLEAVWGILNWSMVAEKYAQAVSA